MNFLGRKSSAKSKQVVFETSEPFRVLEWGKAICIGSEGHVINAVAEIVI